MQKLEKLEEESTQADLRGKRKLRKLEKEIGLLKEELEQTREKGAELEERVMKKVAKHSGLSAEEEEEKRKEREERVKALRRKSTGEDEVEKPLLDFAPAPELPKTSAFKASIPASIPEEPDAPVETEESLSTSTFSNLPVPSSSGTSSAVSPSSSLPSSASLNQPLPTSLSQTHPLEYAIIAQLLSKIHELEETNVQISKEQRATSERLNVAQHQVEKIKRAYDCLGDDDDEVEVWVVPDEDIDDSNLESLEGGEDDAASAFGSPLRSLRVPTGQTIRFSSLRRTIEGDTSRLALVDDPEDDFANGVIRQSTTRSVLFLDIDNGRGKGKKPATGVSKARKTVVGLFDPPGEDGDDDSEEVSKQPRRYPPKLNVTPTFRLSPIPIRPVGASDDLANVSGWSTTATDNDNDPSQSFDSLSSVSDDSVYASPLPPNLEFNLPDSRSPSPSPSALSVGGALHTLGSELGSEFGDDWGERAGNHHLRTTSLYDLKANVSMESGGSVPGGWVLDGEEEGSLAESDRPHVPEIDIESEDDHARVTSGTSTAVARSVSGGSASGSATPMGTPTKSHFSFNGHLHPHVVVQPPTPSPRGPKSRGSSRLAASKSLPRDGSGLSMSVALEQDKLEKVNSRNARLSQTVRARTSRWAERRYAELPLPPLSPVLSPTLTNVPFPTSMDFSLSELGLDEAGLRRRRSAVQLRRVARASESRRRTASTAMEKMDESFEEAVHRVSRSISFSASGSKSSMDLARFREMELNFDCSDVEPERETPHEQEFRPVRRDVSGAEAQVAKKPYTGFVRFILEVWLWLQFAIVVMVFLWAMARRGPKNVLEDAERTRRQSQKK